MQQQPKWQFTACMEAMIWTINRLERESIWMLMRRQNKSETHVTTFFFKTLCPQFWWFVAVDQLPILFDDFEFLSSDESSNIPLIIIIFFCVYVLSRDRNREHAKNTRLRKKAYVLKLKELVDQMNGQKDMEERERRALGERIHDTVRENSQSFFWRKPSLIFRNNLADHRLHYFNDAFNHIICMSE